MMLRRSTVLRTLSAAALAATAASAGVDRARAGSMESASYDVTITNLTMTQTLSPPVVATHYWSTNVFAVGAAATPGVQQVAENGMAPALVAELEGNADVTAVAAGEAPLPPGESVTLTVSGTPGDAVSVAAMLICTNDGFTGVDSKRLPLAGSSATWSGAYEAGTELNTEDLAHLVPPCQQTSGVTDDEGAAGTDATDPALAEGGVVQRHAGIMDTEGDLTTEAHGWTDPVAQIDVALADEM